jgi:hypothetical protein
MTNKEKTPWRSDAQGVNKSWPSIVDAAGALVARTYGADADKQMRRIVACVNTCVGIPTAALEGVSLRELIAIMDETTTPEALSAPVNAAILKILEH